MSALGLARSSGFPAGLRSQLPPGMAMKTVGEWTQQVLELTTLRRLDVRAVDWGPTALSAGMNRGQDAWAQRAQKLPPFRSERGPQVCPLRHQGPGGGHSQLVGGLAFPFPAGSRDMGLELGEVASGRRSRLQSALLALCPLARLSVAVKGTEAS